MPVTYLELENFKSYAGKQRIGPFFNFTCVIGPNGSGKSNLMDAMSFVLGVLSRVLRSSQMKDLIFRPPGSEYDDTLSARASLVYVEPTPVTKKGEGGDERDDADEDDEDDEEENNAAAKKMKKEGRLSKKLPKGKTTIFSRMVTTKGTGEYQINGKTVTFKQYETKLATIGVLLKARNFLVFQGDVEGMARKNPKQLVEMFENLSGSAELKEEYEAALKAKEEAEQRTIFAFNKTKEHKSERRVLKEQKEEAERFHTLLSQRTSLKTNYFLWLLFHIHSDVQQRESTLSELQESLSEHQAVVSEKEALLKKAKKEASKARSQSSAKDKQRMKFEAEVDKLQPSVIESSEAIIALMKRITADAKAVSKIEKEKSAHGEKLAELEEEIREYQEKEEELQNEYDELKDSESGVGSMTEEQEMEYEKIRDAAAVASAVPRRKLQSAVRSLESARATAAKVVEERKELQGRKDDAERSVGELTARKETLEKSLEMTQSELATSESTLSTLQKSVSEYQIKRAAIETQLEKIHNTLRQAKDDRRKDKEEERILNAIGALKRHFPGVKGRLADLCRPSQQRYNLAVTVAGGKDMDAIVVDGKKTAFDCIKYLRDQRIGTATFLPLDSLQTPTPESTERLRAMAENDGRYRLAADVIRVSNDEYRRAVLYAVGNTVVCDSLDIAREICFSRGGARGSSADDRIKAVTVKGAVISKAGTMTGGVTQDDTNRAGRWSDQKLDELRSKKEALEVEREDLDSDAGRGSGSHTAKTEDLRNAIGNLRNKEQYTKSDLEYTKKKLHEQVTLLKSSKKSFDKLDKKAAEAEEGVTEANDLVVRYRQEVRDVEEKLFAPFREKTGIADLRAYDEAIGKAREDFVKKRTDIREHLAKLTAKKKYEDEKDFDSKLAKALTRKVTDESQHDEAKKLEEKLLSQVSEIKAKLADAESTLKQATEAEQEKEEVVRDARNVLKEAEGDYNKVSKTMNAEENDLMILRQKLHETLQKARVDEVELPMLDNEDVDKDDGDNIEDSQASSARTSSRSRSSNSQSATQESSAFSEHFSQREDSKVAKDRRDAGKVDFSSMDEDLKMRRSASEEDKLKTKFESRISKLTQEIEGIAPNMKASDAFDTMTEKVKETVDDFNTAKEESRRANEAFNKARKARSHKFNTAFKQIDSALKIIYTDMTKSSKHPLGGNAYLSLDDSDEPYRGGMKFNAMPPMKRFRDMEQLSGGEKTVAALSLLFAIHSYRPAPFFIMDEVDAALDNVNVLKVCNYIRQRSGDFQCIVISLKDMFYERSESLVGICRDVSSNSSRTLTLDLTKYDRNSGGGKRSRGGGDNIDADQPKRPKRTAASEQ